METKIVNFYKSNSEYEKKLKYYQRIIQKEWRSFLKTVDEEQFPLNQLDVDLYQNFMRIIDRNIHNTWLDNHQNELYLNTLDKLSEEENLFNILIYTSLVDQNKNEILNADYDIVLVVVISLAELPEIEMNDFLKIYEIYSNKAVQKSLNEYTDDKNDKRDILVGCLEDWQEEQIDENTLLEEIEFNIPTREEIKNILLCSNFGTCHQIYEYFYYQCDTYNQLIPNYFNLIPLEEILRIDELDINIKKRYIEEIKLLMKKDLTLVNQVNCVIVLTRIYIKNNKIESSDKHENRRF